ncbi:MAG: MFS transporter [Chloroflexi bacterium]|nr:MFS transporter [Chloroflexota bacterium]
MLERWRNMGRNTRLMAIALVLWAVGEGLWIYLHPLYLDSLGASPEQIGFILSLSGLARIFVMLPAGILTDRYGAKQMLVPGWGLGLLGVIIIAAAPNLTIVSIGYLIYGLSAMAIPVINLYLVQSIDADDTTTFRFRPQQILTYIHGLFWMGVIVSPFIGGLIADQTSLRAVFWVSAFWFGLSTIIVLRTRSYPVIREPDKRFMATIRGYAIFWRNRSLITIYLILGLGFSATILGFSFVSKLFQDSYGFSNGQIGLLMSILAFGSFVWNIWLGDRQPWQSFIASAGLSGVAFLLIISTDNWFLLALACLILGGWEVMRPIATGIVSEYVPPEQQGVAFGAVNTLHGVGLFIAPGVAGLLYSINYSYPFILGTSIIPLLSIVVWWFLSSQTQIRPEGVQ